MTDITDLLPPPDDIAAARGRMTAWWAGEDLGRPALDLVANRTPEGFELRDPPAGWLTDYSLKDLDWREQLCRQRLVSRSYHGEALPVVRPDLGPCGLAACLGSPVEETEGNVWFGPCLEEEHPDPKGIVFDPEDGNWKLVRELCARQLAIAPGVVQVGYPDLGESLDVLASLRGVGQLLMDFFDRPTWIEACLKRLDAIHRECYGLMAADIELEGSIFHWMWAAGRTGRFQCDTSAMLGPDAFKDLFLPSLKRLVAEHDHTIYHWDGTDALVHEEAILSVADLEVVQWVPGAGQPMVHDRQWWPLYHRILHAGKKVALVGFKDVDSLVEMRKAFGKEWQRFFLRMHVKDAAIADSIVEAVTL